jgi:hypothetical protein
MHGRFFVFAGLASLLSLSASVALASGVGAELTFNGATGTLDGTPFNDQTVTISTLYDTSNVDFTADLGGEDVYQVEGWNQLATVNVGNVYDGIYVPYLANPVGGIVEWDIDAASGPTEYLSADLGNYSLTDYQGLTNTGGQLSAYINVALPQEWPTGNGDLSLSSVAGGAFYQAFAVNVPEPASLGVVGLASGLLTLRRRRARMLS